MAPKQSTLGSFVKYPPGAKGPPAQQSDIRDAFKSKRPKSTSATANGANGSNGANATDKPVKKEAPGMDLDTDVKGEAGAESSSSSSSSSIKKEETTAAATPETATATETEAATEAESDEDEAPRTASRAKATSKATNGEASGRKKRRVEESDEDEEDKVQSKPSRTKRATAAAKSASPPPAAAEKRPRGRPKKVKVEDGDAAEPAVPASATNAKKKTDATASTASKPTRSRSRSASVSSTASERRSASPASADEDKEDRKSHQKIAAIFQKPFKTDSKGATLTAKGSDYNWADGKPIPYAALADVFSRIEATTKRLEIQAILSDFLTDVIARSKSPEEVTQVIYLCINRLCPDYMGVELGLGEALIIKALAQTFGREPAKIKKDLEKEGDLGLVAMASRTKQPTMFKASALTVPNVFSTLTEIANLSGNKSQEKKIGLIMKLLAACRGEETKWIIRSLEGKLRIGLAEKTVIIGLAHSAVLARLDKENKRNKLSAEELSAELEKGTSVVKAVYSEVPNYDRIVPALIEGGPDGLREACRLTPGIPLKPMLAKPTKAITEVLDRFEGKAFTCEYKYDGERAQVHFYVPGESHGVEDAADGAAPTNAVDAPGTEKKGKLGVFSRNSEDMSVKYPDLLESIPRFVKRGTKSFVLDAEVAAWKHVERDEAGTVVAGGLQPFQQLSTRKRKGVDLANISVRVKLFAFDVLYLNGRSLLKEDLATRRRLLREHFQPVEDEFDFATSQDCHSVEEMQVFLDASVADGCEGLMVKMLEGPDAYYEPSRRSMNWLKLKKDYLAGTGDSLDLVVIGADYGKGKRTNVYGAFLLACWDADSESFQSVCMIGTGFSEASLEEFTRQLKPLELAQKKKYYDTGDAKPHVFFEPKVVWEVLTADLSLSPKYTAAKGLADDASSRGVSLRFPRFIRLRDDKDPEDSTSPEQIAEMYRTQAVTAASRGKKKAGGAGGGGDDDWW